MPLDATPRTSAAPTLKDGLPCGRLILKLATTPQELEHVLRLRFQVFNEELGEGIPENASRGIDEDSFDEHCDHLMVIDGTEVIGTYRLLAGPRRPGRFYSETEFDLSAFPIDPRLTVELGRGCIQPAHRKQTTLMALFWGLSKYIASQNARYLIGCGSLPLMSADDAEATFATLTEQGIVRRDGGVSPLVTNSFAGNASAGEPNVPPLLKLYIEFGAHVLGRPAYDPVFGCYDLFMFFDMEKISPWGQDLLARFDKRLR